MNQLSSSAPSVRPSSDNQISTICVCRWFQSSGWFIIGKYPMFIRSYLVRGQVIPIDKDQYRYLGTRPAVKAYAPFHDVRRELVVISSEIQSRDGKKFVGYMSYSNVVHGKMKN